MEAVSVLVMYVYTSFSCELILLLNHFTTTEFYYCLTLQLPKVTTARTLGHGGRQEARAFLRQRTSTSVFTRFHELLSHEL